MTTLSKQYNAISETFSENHEDGNKYSNQAFFNAILSQDVRGKKILDLGCGDGTDMLYYKYRISADVHGVDSSKKLLSTAKERGLSVKLGSFVDTGHEEKSFDIILSKYAMQTSQSIDPIYEEVARVVKKGGLFIFLVVHPFRQFFEKTETKKDYFKKTIATSVLFGGKVTVKEPTHTMEEYLSENFFKLFTLESFEERSDFYSAEKISENNYPTYAIITARKK